MNTAYNYLIRRKRNEAKNGTLMDVLRRVELLNELNLMRVALKTPLAKSLFDPGDTCFAATPVSSADCQSSRS